MKSKGILLCLSLSILLVSCQEDVEKYSIDDLYIEFMLDGASYLVSNTAYQLEPDGGLLICNFMNGYVEGNHTFRLSDPEHENYVHSVDFVITKKVFKDELNLSDETSYMQHVLNAKDFGFPTNQRGYFLVFDSENEIFAVSREVSAEGYISIVTNGDEVFNSTSVVPIERESEQAYLIIDKVIENKKDTKSDYKYIIEGRFKVNLYKTYSSATNKVMEGSFRWPIREVLNSELLILCD